jgi:hypothetical protein
MKTNQIDLAQIDNQALATVSGGAATKPYTGMWADPSQIDYSAKGDQLAAMKKAAQDNGTFQNRDGSWNSMNAVRGAQDAAQDAAQNAQAIMGGVPAFVKKRIR